MVNLRQGMIVWNKQTMVPTKPREATSCGSLLKRSLAIPISASHFATMSQFPVASPGLARAEPREKFAKSFNDLWQAITCLSSVVAIVRTPDVSLVNRSASREHYWLHSEYVLQWPVMLCPVSHAQQSLTSSNKYFDAKFIPSSRIWRLTPDCEVKSIFATLSGCNPDVQPRGLSLVVGNSGKLRAVQISRYC